MLAQDPQIIVLMKDVTRDDPAFGTMFIYKVWAVYPLSSIMISIQELKSEPRGVTVFYVIISRVPYHTHYNIIFPIIHVYMLLFLVNSRVLIE